jgi:adenylate cyclase
MTMGSLPALDIDLLRSFVLIAEGGSFTRAAERVGRTQSAISLQVKKLEALIGHRLFERGKGGGVQLTPQGERFLDRARGLIAHNDEIVGAISAEPQGDETHAEKSSHLFDADADRLAASQKPSIAVLPFHNLSDEAGQDYFADGIVDDIITGLSRIKWLFVIARNSTFAYKGRPIDVRRVGRELGVRYVLQGGVRKSGSRLRISAQLIEAETGAHLWADKYDGALEDVFELQDWITDRVVGIVEPNLQRSEVARARRKRVENLDAYNLYLRALPLIVAHMPQQTEAALLLLKQALKRDPDYAAAHALTAWCHEWRFTRGGFHEADRSASLVHARAAIASNTDDAATLAIAGFAMTFLAREREAAISALDRAVALNPSCATALYLSAHAHAMAQDCETAASHAGRALLLSPFDTLAFEAHLALGNVAVQQERYDDAASSLGRAAQANPNFSTSYFMRALAMASAGRVEAARSLVRRGLELEPGFRVRMFSEIGIAPVVAKQFAKGGRLLGLPE